MLTFPFADARESAKLDVKAAEKNLASELARVDKNVLLAYGGGSIKKNGIYDELIRMLTAAEKTVTEFTGIMPNPTYAKVQEGAALTRDDHIGIGTCQIW